MEARQSIRSSRTFNSSRAVQLPVNVLPIVYSRKSSAISINHIPEHITQALLSRRATTFFYETVPACLEAIENGLNFALRKRRKALADTFGFINRVPLIPVLLELFADVGPERYCLE
jgi:hypothetical protein